MVCRNCPYAKMRDDKLVSGEPYAYPIPDDNTGRITQSSFCEKIDGEVSIYECGDTNSDDDKSGRKYSGKKRRNKRERDLKYKNHLKDLSKYSGWSGSVYDESRAKPYYRRYYHSNRGRKDNRFRFEKKQSNIVVRNYKGGIHKGGAYKKLYDYWCFID